MNWAATVLRAPALLPCVFFSDKTGTGLGIHPLLGCLLLAGLTNTQPARAKHTGTVILLHGLGDTGNGWAPVGPQVSALAAGVLCGTPGSH